MAYVRRSGILAGLFASPLPAQSPSVEFFEKEIRPVFVERSYGCHSSKTGSI